MISKSFRPLALLWRQLFTTALSLICIAGLLTYPSTLHAQSDSVPPFVLVDENALQIVAMIEELSGKTALVAQNIPQTSINFSSRVTLSKQDALRALESLLSMNGISVVPLDDKFFRVVQSGEINFQAPDFLTGSSLNLPPSEKRYSKLYEPKFLGVTELQPVLRPFLSPQAGFVVIEKASALLVTDALTNLQRIEMLLQKIDQPSPVVEEIVFYSLQHVKARDLVQRLQNMQKTSLKRYLDGNTTFEADERTNQIIVLTHTSNVPLIDRIINNIDVDVAPSTRSEVYYIKHAEATNVASLLQQVISDRRANRDEGSVNNSGNPPIPVPTPQTGDTPPASTPNSADTSVANSLIGDNENVQFSDQVSVVADERSNAIVVSGTASDLAHIQGLVSKIDIVLAQVRIDVLIVEVTLTKDQVRGLDTFGVSLDDLNNVGLNLAGPSTSRLSEPSFSYAGSFNRFTFDAVINTSQRNSNVEVLSNPTLITTHNQEATITVGESRPVITSTNTDTTGINTQSSVSFRDIGIELKVKPLISADGVVQMEISQKVESVVDTVRISNNDQPVIGKREAISFVTVSDNNVIVLGGLQERLVTEAKAKMTFLGSLPILGDALFSPTTQEKTNRELIIFLRPKVLYNTDMASQDARSTPINANTPLQQEKWYETGKINALEFEDPEPETSRPELQPLRGKR